MKVRVAALGLAVIFSGLQSPTHGADDPLKVCLDEDRPPFSSHQRGKPGTGFDVTLAQVIADRFGRPLKSSGSKASSTRFEPAARSQCAAFRRALLAGRRLRVDQRFAGRARREDGQASGFRRRDPRRSPAPRRTRCPHAQSGLRLFAANGGARTQDARPQINEIGDLSGLRLLIESGRLAMPS